MQKTCKLLSFPVFLAPQKNNRKNNQRDGPWAAHGHGTAHQPHRDSLSVQISVVCFDWWVGVGLVLGGILGGRPIRRPLKICIFLYYRKNTKVTYPYRI